MKNKTTIALFTVVLLSCQSETTKESAPIEDLPVVDRRIRSVSTNRFEVITYDGCEYLIYKDEVDSNSDYGFMAHKGNCSNPIHAHNKEEE